LTTADQVVEDLYAALQEFFALFPEYVGRDFFITGESYGGRYVPQLTYKIIQEQEIKVNAIAIGNGCWVPFNQ
jgi:carboxypeptidase C (cathepsin A)